MILLVFTILAVAACDQHTGSLPDKAIEPVDSTVTAFSRNEADTPISSPQSNSNDTVSSPVPFITPSMASNEGSNYQREANQHYIQGSSYYSEKKYNLAIEEFSKAISLMPNFLFAYQSRAYAYEAVGNYDQAEQDYEQVIRLNPQAVNAYRSIGEIEVRKGNYKEAINNFTQAINIRSNDYSLYEDRGDSYEKDGQGDEAIVDYKEALVLINKPDGRPLSSASSSSSDDQARIQQKLKKLGVNP